MSVGRKIVRQALKDFKGGSSKPLEVLARDPQMLKKLLCPFKNSTMQTHFVRKCLIIGNRKCKTNRLKNF